jgi:hypothetical protein
MANFRNSRFSNQDKPNYATDFQELLKSRKMADTIISICNDSENALAGQISALITKHKQELILERGLIENQQTRNQIRGLGRKLESLNRGMAAMSRNRNQNVSMRYRGSTNPHGFPNRNSQNYRLNMRQHPKNVLNKVSTNNLETVLADIEPQIDTTANNPKWESKLKCGGKAFHEINETST